MDDLELRHVFSSLCTLAEQGPLPVQAYSMLVRRMCPEALAEELHRGWLADSRFAPTAAGIILNVCTAEPRDVALSSSCLALILNDYRLRNEIRADSKLMWRNAFRALFHLYPIYRQLDPCFSKCFIQPMFTALEELFDADPDQEDYETAAGLFSTFGRTMNDLRPVGVERLICRGSDRCRLSSDELPHSEGILDLHTFRWEEVKIPEHYITGRLDTMLIDKPPTELSPFVKPKRLRESSVSSNGSRMSKLRDSTSSPNSQMASPLTQSMNIPKIEEEIIPLEKKETFDKLQPIDAAARPGMTSETIPFTVDGTMFQSGKRRTLSASANQARCASTTKRCDADDF
ncbi:hypothetical protein PRIPAC_94645 [Pristionchus pacificus]|uniref:Uncharacterized protein n=1 Tax=Pristionchus pacificus TaxID=54126 RepID=A0A2A6BR51_PRIPA|nr:hypothetical protein PRIPAC_94645 [Pristionchus pacificus]|eukprot:PDM68375.1 hypothetical protein PRIPAC_46419 [Pristionchus pacificus]